jgi:hypothetical protein
MGAFRWVEEKTGQFEITYGGKESPFMGIDATQPATEITKGAFTKLQNWLILENRLVAVGFAALPGPGNGDYINWAGFPSPAGLGTPQKLLGFGTIPNGTQQNLFAVLASQQPNAGGYQELDVYVWNTLSAAPVKYPFSYNASSIVPATTATATVTIFGGEQVNMDHNYDAGTVTVTINGRDYSADYDAPSTRHSVALDIANAIAADSSAVVTTTIPAGNNPGFVLTSKLSGAVGNYPLSYSSTTSEPGFLQPSFGAGSMSQLSGGADAVLGTPVVTEQLTYKVIGTTLYIAGWPSNYILQVDLVNGLAVTTSYLGASTLISYNGSLYALGVVPALPNTGAAVLTVDNPELVIAWSEPLTYTQWNALDANSNITGAGFEQLGDISDYLTGAFVINSVLYVLRAQGLTYGSPQTSSTEPVLYYPFSLSDFGEGCQSNRLFCQYGQAGAFVGNSSVWGFTGQLQDIGKLIKSLFLPAIQAGQGDQKFWDCTNSIAGNFLYNGVDALLICFNINGIIYVFNSDNRTWTTLTTTDTTADTCYINALPTNASVAVYADQEYASQNLVLMFQKAAAPGTDLATPLTYALQPIVNSFNDVSDEQTLAIFEAEQILIGRDVTIEGLYIQAAGNAELQITVQALNDDGSLVGSTQTLQLTTNAAMYIYYQVDFPVPVTGKSPQLQIEVLLTGGVPAGSLNACVSKISMYGTVVTSQRPA